ncbi:hypothetical protein C7B69_26595 [filamentous cyanobacterium Phorm 46]|nr:hypothetical protein C7B69_26595 [filamentous cyanobacterium Phorm 46]
MLVLMRRGNPPWFCPLFDIILDIWRIGPSQRRKRKAGKLETYSQLASNPKTVLSFLKSVSQEV